MKKNQSFDKLRTRRIGIDARFFGPKDKGFGRYTQQLVEHLEKIDPLAGGNQYFIFSALISCNLVVF